MATESLLSEFPPVSTEQWERIIRENVKGAEYASRMIWHPEEGLAVKPYYRAEDLAGLQFLGCRTRRLPICARRSRHWLTGASAKRLDIADPEEANRAAGSAVAAGAEEIAFPPPETGELFRPRSPSRKSQRDSSYIAQASSRALSALLIERLKKATARGRRLNRP